MLCRIAAQVMWGVETGRKSRHTATQLHLYLPSTHSIFTVSRWLTLSHQPYAYLRLHRRGSLFMRQHNVYSPLCLGWERFEQHPPSTVTELSSRAPGLLALLLMIGITWSLWKCLIGYHSDQSLYIPPLHCFLLWNGEKNTLYFSTLLVEKNESKGVCVKKYNK